MSRADTTTAIAGRLVDERGLTPGVARRLAEDITDDDMTMWTRDDFEQAVTALRAEVRRLREGNL